MTGPGDVELEVPGYQLVRWTGPGHQRPTSRRSVLSWLRGAQRTTFDDRLASLLTDDMGCKDGVRHLDCRRPNTIHAIVRTCMSWTGTVLDEECREGQETATATSPDEHHTAQRA
ncbi:hypothetical protein JDV02_009930 [Purpureocillium takamizusanense]|uniref:Uncharacterized protein n=1 Tax=Purpureocillium takamizusanense TaxID=2060973 RepID=A0A9Q8QQT1_9HYPO|nr:uncharacterized protein JDV02_009930 [Purpureocillium takamizusanense]UNI24160.1 hypothetical protein JDV02_009930 [Purpureocillium takamizusanense]